MSSERCVPYSVLEGEVIIVPVFTRQKITKPGLDRTRTPDLEDKKTKKWKKKWKRISHSISSTLFNYFPLFFLIISFLLFNPFATLFFLPPPERNPFQFFFVAVEVLHKGKSLCFPMWPEAV